MAQYSPEDKIAFKKKDYLYARQTAANVTSAIFEGKEIKPEDFILFANDIFNWLFQEQEKLDIKSTSRFQESLCNQDSTKTVPVIDKEVNNSPPAPTVEQKKVLDAIQEKLAWSSEDWNDLCEQVLQYSIEIAKVDNPTYPKSMNSVDKIVNWINNRGN